MDVVWDDSSGFEEDLERERRARRHQHHTAGLRDGVDQGKEETVEEGFFLGFREGRVLGFHAGLMRGTLLAAQPHSGLYPGIDDEVLKAGKVMLGDEAQLKHVVLDAARSRAPRCIDLSLTSEEYHVLNLMYATGADVAIQPAPGSDTPDECSWDVASTQLRAQLASVGVHFDDLWEGRLGPLKLKDRHS